MNISPTPLLSIPVKTNTISKVRKNNSIHGNQRKTSWIWKDAFRNFTNLQNNITQVSQNMNLILQSFFISLSDSQKNKVLLSVFQQLHTKIQEVNPNKITNSSNVFNYRESLVAPFQFRNDTSQIIQSIINKPLTYSQICASFNFNNMLDITSPMWILLDSVLSISTIPTISVSNESKNKKNNTIRKDPIPNSTKQRRIPTLFQKNIRGGSKNGDTSIFHQILTQFQQQAANIYQLINDLHAATNQYAALFKNNAPSSNFYEADDLYSLFQFDNLSPAFLTKTLENVYIDFAIIRNVVGQSESQMQSQPFEKLFQLFMTFVTHVTYTIPTLCVTIYKYHLIRFLPLQIQNTIKMHQLNQSNIPQKTPILYAYLRLETAQNSVRY